jgi:hypothetical protein
MSSFLVPSPVKGNLIIQILSAINYRFLGAEFSLGLAPWTAMEINGAR